MRNQMKLIKAGTREQRDGLDTQMDILNKEI
jgi:hypothetical protein